MVSTLPVDDLLRNLSIKDLRMQCRARGINPAGNADSLRERLQEGMHAASDYRIHSSIPEGATTPAVAAPPADAYGSRPPSSRSTYGTGGGASQIHFGDYKTDYSTQQYGSKGPETTRTAAEAMGPGAAAGEDSRRHPHSEAEKGKYSSSGGGHSQLSFGDYQLPHQNSGRQGLVPVTTEEDVKREEVSVNINDTVKPLLLKDLRIQLRARGLSPAGPVEDLRQRLAEDMMASGNLSLALDVNLLNPYAQGVVPPTPPSNPSSAASGRNPAGAQSQISFGDYTLPHTGVAGGQAKPPAHPSAPSQSPYMHDPMAQGTQNSFRPSSRCIEPPGGRGNQIHFG